MDVANPLPDISQAQWPTVNARVGWNRTVQALISGREPVDISIAAWCGENWNSRCGYRNFCLAWAASYDGSTSISGRRWICVKKNWKPKQCIFVVHGTFVSQTTLWLFALFVVNVSSKTRSKQIVLINLYFYLSYSLVTFFISSFWFHTLKYLEPLTTFYSTGIPAPTYHPELQNKFLEHAWYLGEGILTNIDDWGEVWCLLLVPSTVRC